MSNSLYLELTTAEQAAGAMKAEFYPYCKAKLAEGLCLAVSVTELEDARSLAQNRFYWGVVLCEISEQAKLNGIGAEPLGWHLYYKRKCLGYAFKKTRLPGKKRPSVTRTLRSTRALSVKKMSKYLEQVQADAATEFGVAFSATNWERT